MFFDNYTRLCNSVGKSPTGVALELGISRSTVSHWRHGMIPRRPALLKVADYFNVSPESLLEDISSHETDDDLKVALFGGDGEVTDEMWQEVLEFAEFVKKKRAEKKK